MYEEVVVAKYKRVIRDGTEYWLVIFDLRDFFTNKNPAEYHKNISDELADLIGNIRRILPDRKPSRVPRRALWDIGDMIIKKREEIMEKYGIYISNLVEAVAVNLKLSSRTVNFFVQFRDAIPKEKVNENVPWKVYQICLLLKDKSKIEECIGKYIKGELKTTTEVLKYVKKCNKV